MSSKTSQQKKIHSDRQGRALHSSRMRLLLLILVLAIVSASGRVVDFELDVGGIPDDFTEETGTQFDTR